MSVWVFLGSAGEGNDDFELLEEVPMVDGLIGTDASCALRLRDPMLTPKHARSLKRDGAWYVGGIAAASPTLVNGVATRPGEAVQLAIGDVVQLGSARFRFGGEPPAREGIDANDEVKLMIWADRAAERGSPIGIRILEEHAPSPSWLPGAAEAVDEGRMRATWTRGLLTELSIRECTLEMLNRILADETALSLERLEVAVSSCGYTSEEECARALFQVIAETRPPRLRTLELGLLHAPLDPNRAGRDHRALARRVPLERTLEQSYQHAGSPRITMLASGPRWPAVGTVTPLPVGDHATFGLHPVAQVHLSMQSGRGQKLLIYGHDDEEPVVRINGFTSNSHRCLLHGDVVDGPAFSFRFEET